MQMIIGFTRRKWAWACLNKLFWASIALALLTLAVGWWWPGPMTAGTPSDSRLRVWGMLLQLLGAYTVFRDLASTARDFGRANILKRSWTWFKSGFIAQPVILVSADLTGASSITGGRVQVRPGIDSNGPPDARITALESYVAYIDKDVAAAFTEIGRKGGELSIEIKTKTAVLHDVLDATDRRLAQAVVGNYSVLVFGAVWLGLGIVISSIAPEIVKLVAHQYQAVWTAF
jgi:hypothetical protein